MLVGGAVHHHVGPMYNGDILTEEHVMSTGPGQGYTGLPRY